jgi:glycosyltransferase involved in cell wall biosynthesis
MNEISKKLAVIIPAFNEQDSIELVVNDINSITINGLEIVAIVVNDSSKDKTADIAAQLNCILLDLPVNLGIGGAVQTGFKYAFNHDFDFAIQVDGDGQHPAQEISKLYKAVLATQSNVVIGSRFIEKAGFQSTGMRRFGIWFLRNWIKLFSGIVIFDNTSGFRLLDRQALALVQNYYPDEYPEPESIIWFCKNGLRITETAVLMKERQGGQSSIRAFNQLYYMIKVSLAIFYTYLRTK